MNNETRAGNARCKEQLSPRCDSLFVSVEKVTGINPDVTETPWDAYR